MSPARTKLGSSFQSLRWSLSSHNVRLISTSMRLLASPISIQATSSERSCGKLSEQKLESAVRQIHYDGLVVIQNAVDTPLLEALNARMVADALKLRSKGKETPFNYNPGNLQQDAPPVKQFFHPEIFLSKSNGTPPASSLLTMQRPDPIATQITSAVLGPRPKLTFCSGNSAMPPTSGSPPQRQPVHSDADFTHPDHPFALVVNVPLIDMRPENGSTEVWLGTHSGFGIEAQEGVHGERASGRIRQSLLEERAKTCPPSQPSIPRGSIIVRDLRLWHAGMPNMTPEVRVMLALSTYSCRSFLRPSTDFEQSTLRLGTVTR